MARDQPITSYSDFLKALLSDRERFFEEVVEGVAWALLFAFVGIQLAWSLRPFLGDRNQPFQVFGSYQGNFYAAIIYAVNKLMHGDEKPTPSPGRQDSIPRFRGFVIPPIDTVADSSHRRKRP